MRKMLHQGILFYCLGCALTLGAMDDAVHMDAWLTKKRQELAEK